MIARKSSCNLYRNILGFSLVLLAKRADSLYHALMGAPEKIRRPFYWWPGREGKEGSLKRNINHNLVPIGILLGPQC